MKFLSRVYFPFSGNANHLRGNSNGSSIRPEQGWANFFTKGHIALTVFSEGPTSTNYRMVLYI